MNKKADPSICCLQETHFRPKDTFQLKVKGWKSIYHANRCEKKAWVAVLILDKVEFKTKTIKRDKEGHDIIIKGTTQQEDTIIVNIYAPNMGAPKYVKQLITNVKEVINSNTIILGSFNIPLKSMDRISKQKINKKTMALNDILDQMDLTDIFRTFYPKTVECTFFSSAHGTFSRIDDILGNKTNLNKLKKNESHTMHLF